MRKRLLERGISLLLVLCLITSCLGAFTVFAEGADSTSGGEGEITLLIKRDFEDSKLLSNGIGALAAKGNTFELVNSGSNRYLSLMADSTAGDNSGYIQFGFVNSGVNYAPTSSGSLVFSVDVSFDAEGEVDYGRLLQFKTASDNFGDLMTAKDGKILLLGKETNLLADKNAFHNVQFVINYNDASNVTIDAWYDGVKITSKDSSFTQARLNCIRYGPTTGVNNEKYSNLGQAALIDNFTIYTSDSHISDPTEVTFIERDRGLFFDKYGGNVVDTGFFTEGLYMKTGVEYALLNGSKVTASAPVKLEDRVYLPIKSLAEFLGYSFSVSSGVFTLRGSKDITLTVGNSYATVGGKSVSLSARVALLDEGADSYGVVALEDVSVLFGLVAEYSEMGLIAITEKGGVIESYSMESLLELMKRFIFDHVGSDGSQNYVFNVDDMLSLEHPYILASQSDFNYYREVYLSEEPSELKDYLTAIVEDAHELYNLRASKKLSESSTYQGMGYYYTMPYTSTNGYDPAGGRQGEAANHMKKLINVAFAYQITRDDRLALFAYQYTRQIGSWYHWGPGHFLNAADTMGPYALVYDMLYNAWTRLESEGASYVEKSNTIYVDVAFVRDALFTNGVLASYYAVDNIECPWARCVGGVSKDDSHFSKTKNNWNAVCASGTATAALALMGDLTDVTDYTITQSVYANGKFTFTEGVNIQSLGDHRGFVTMQDYCEYLVNRVVYDLEMNGLGQYAPDGSYVESPTYWSYGTNNLFKLCAHLENTVGTSYGLMDTWGIDRTCYFAMNTQSSDYLTWNYHDTGDAGKQDTSMFAFVASSLSNPELVFLRKHILKNGGGTPTIYDILYYTDSDEVFDMPALEYHMDGIEGFAVRDSWSTGAIYAGIMGGYNDCTHGQMDSGAFVYHNNGKIWFGDLGTEGYNTYKFGADSLEGRYGYYVMSAQGNNTLTVTSRQDILPFGQKIYGGGEMYSTYSNEYGAYALIDNSLAYGYNIVNYAKRGMLFTNDRKTVVIQDEVSFKREETAYWFGHILEDAMISTDGRIAYLSDGETIIRATIISDNKDLKFTMMDTYTFVVDASHGPNYSYDKNGVRENDRTGDKKLAIKCEGVRELKLAVVIEEIPFAAETVRVGYEWCDMDSWVPTFDGRVDKDTLIDADASGVDCGSVEASLGNLSLSTNDVSSGMLLSATESLGASNLSFKADANSIRGSYLASNVLVAELDVCTLSTLPEGAAITISGRGSDIFTISADSLVSVKDRWHRLLIMIDGEQERAYVYLDGVYHSAKDVTVASVKGLALSVSVPEGALASGSTLAVDNVTVRYFSEEYKQAYLREALRESGSLALFRDVIKTYHKSAPLAAITPDRKVSIGYLSGSDTPVIDLDAVYVYSVEELNSKIYGGAFVSFLRGLDTPYNVTSDITVYTGGFDVALSSDSYVAERMDTNTYRFYPGAIEVRWYGYDGALAYTETVTGTRVASPSSNVPGFGEVTELYNDGVYTYRVKCGWARERGGVALAASELIPTADCCEFYLADSALSDLVYVTVDSKGVLTPKYSVQSFATDMAAGYARISLARDITTNLSSTFTKSTSLYLNGYTLTFDETTSAQPFTVKGGTFNVYGGGGKIVNNSTQAFIYAHSSVAGVNIYDLDLITKGVANDLRKNTITYDNVDIYKTSSGVLFTIYDRNNAQSEATMPTVVLNGSSIQYLGVDPQSYIGNVYYNAKLVIKGGSVINVPKAILVNLINNTSNDGVTDYTASVDYMALEIEDSSVVVARIADYSNPATGAYADLTAKVKIGNGAKISCDFLDSQILGGCVRVYGGAFANEVVKTEEAARVNWVVGGKTYTEYWKAGSVPVAESEQLKAAIAAETVGAGRKYIFSAGVVSEGDNVTLVAEEITSFSVKMNLTLHAGFDINMYVEKNVTGVSFNSFAIDGEAVSYESVYISGVEYNKITVRNVSPQNAADSFILTITLTEGGKEFCVNISFSLLDYVERVIESSTSEESVALAANILKYVDEACDYAGKSDMSVKSLAEKHRFKFTFTPVDRDNSSLDEITDGIQSVQYNLKSIPRVRFNIKSGYTGVLRFVYIDNGVEKSVSYNAIDGLVDGRAYVELERKAYELDCDIEIWTNGGYGVYNISYYYTYHAKEQDSLTRLLNAIVAYGDAARRYKNS